MKEVRMRVDNVVEDYLARGDHAAENANMGWGPNGMLFAVGEEALRRDTLARMREGGFDFLADLHEAGGVHIHDLGLGFPVPYCSGWSLANLLNEGIQAGAITSKPAKHFRAAINHIVNFIGAASNEFAGAQAFNDVDLLLAPYAYKTFLDYKVAGCPEVTAYKLARRDVSQGIQELLFHLNYNNRWGGQSPFSNITLAITCPADMRDQLALIAGKPLHTYYKAIETGFDVPPTTYGMLDCWQQLITDAMLKTYLKGDARGQGFTFPVLTINVTPEFFEHPARKLVFELTAKYGTPFFQNFINGVSGGQRINPEDVRSMCCRLQLSKEDIRKHVGGLFGNGDQTGSLQVVTISLPFLAQDCKAKLAEQPQNLPILERCRPFFKALEKWMDAIRDEQLWKRETVLEHFNKGFFQMAKANLKRGFKTYFTTIGFIGLWECVEILTGDERSFLTEPGMFLAECILRSMRNKIERYMDETGHLFNLEATPAESASYKLAQKALKTFPDIPHRGLKKAPYFTNSCHIPVEMQDDLSLIFKTQARLQTIPTGGTVTHLYVGEALTAQDVESVVKAVCATPIPYFSISTVFSVCLKHGHIPGAHEFCPYCTAEDAEEIAKTHPHLVVDAA